MDLEPPKDKWNLVFLTLLLYGLGTMTGWNMFITAKDYFVGHKLRNAPDYANHFLAYLGWASQIPNLLFSWFSIFIRFGGSLTIRIVGCLSLQVLIFVFTIILAIVDSSGWPAVFFWLTMILVFLFCGLNAIFQSSVYGLAARLPPKYSGAVVLGSNICGTLVVLLSWMSQLFEDTRISAIYYFIGGMFVLLLCLDTYFALPLNKFYRYHDRLEVSSAPSANQNTRSPYATIFTQAWVQLYNIFFIFVVSLTIFPSVHSDIKPVQPGFLGKNFALITCYLTFNSTAMMGNITASLWQYPRPRWLVIFTTSRLVFVPFFLLCKYKPEERTWPVLFNSDWVYWTAAVLFGWSSGHGSSLGMMYTSGSVAPQHGFIVGTYSAAALVTGLIVGVTFTRLCPIIVSL